MITDENNVIIWQWDSKPFGESLVNEDPDANNVIFIYNLRFPGQYFDVETEIHYNFNRDYSPLIGRYIQSDPIGLNGGLNSYIYVGDNPVNFVDNLGLLQIDVDRAKSVLRNLHPEYYNSTAKVEFGDMPGKFGVTDFYSGDITISNEFSGVLNDDKKTQLIETLAHEYQHSNDSIAVRLRTNTEDLLGISGRHDEIFRNAMYLLREAYEKNLEP